MRIAMFLLLAGMVMVAGAQQPQPGAAPGQSVTLQMGDPNEQMEMTTYMGVSSAPVDETLGKQLGLPRGVGLVIEYVDPEGPAAGVLEAHDVLQKLSDQILVNHGQLAVLVRLQKAGDEVEVTYLRGGKTTVAKVTLKEKMQPKVRTDEWPRRRFDFGGSPMMFNLGNFTNSPNVRQWMQRGERRGSREDRQRPDVQPSQQLNVGVSVKGGAKSTVSMADGDNQLTLSTDENNGKTLTILDQKGAEVFKGPINNDEEMGKVPEAFRTKIGDLQKMSEGLQIRVAPVNKEDQAL